MVVSVPSLHVSLRGIQMPYLLFLITHRRVASNFLTRPFTEASRGEVAPRLQGLQQSRSNILRTRSLMSRFLLPQRWQAAGTS